MEAAEEMRTLDMEAAEKKRRLESESELYDQLEQRELTLFLRSK
jgi:hypothetical protein